MSKFLSYELRNVVGIVYILQVFIKTGTYL